MSARWVSVDELMEIMGRETALVLCRTYGGIEVYIPAKPGPDHRLAPVVGMEALRALADYAGGWHVELPNLRRPKSAKEKILTMLDQGKTHEEIALECKVSTRWVRRLASMLRPQRQGRLPI